MFYLLLVIISLDGVRIGTGINIDATGTISVKQGVIDYNDLTAFSVQFHPEAASGPHDTAFLFDRFIKLMEEK